MEWLDNLKTKELQWLRKLQRKERKGASASRIRKLKFGNCVLTPKLERL